MKTTSLPADEAKATGFATFNNGEHLCVDLDEGWKTISVKTPSGQKITFAFIPKAGRPGHQCVDVCHHGSRKNESGHPLQDVVVFGAGPTYYNSKDDDVTMVTVMMKGQGNAGD